MESFRHWFGELDALIASLIILGVVVVVAVILERVLVRVLRRAYRHRVERAAGAQDIDELGRVKRQQTLVTLLESLVRYGVYGGMLVIALAVMSGGRSNALFGASLVVVLAGFALQRLLHDVVAGALLLFEGQFAVGDVITVHPSELTGTVEEVSLRTTTLRTLGGDRITITNGALVTFTRWSYGQREHRLELIVRGDDALERIEAVCGRERASLQALWVRAPRVDATEPLDAGLIRCMLSLVTAPGHDALVERVAELLRAELARPESAPSLVGPITHLPLYGPTFDRWRESLLLRTS